METVFSVPRTPFEPHSAMGKAGSKRYTRPTPPPAGPTFMRKDCGTKGRIHKANNMGKFPSGGIGGASSGGRGGREVELCGSSD